jgi:Cutinase
MRVSFERSIDWPCPISGLNLLLPLKRRLGDRADIKFLPYSASVLNRGLTYTQSLATGESALRSALTEISNRCPATRFALAGYSQGADGVGDVAADIGNGRGPVGPEKIVAVGTFADPRRGRPDEMLIGRGDEGPGILGPRPEGPGALRGRWATFCRTEPVDRYCTIGSDVGDSILTGVAAVVGGTGNGRAQAGALTSGLAEDFRRVDLSGMDAAVKSIQRQLRSPTGRFDSRTTAANVLSMLKPDVLISQVVAVHDGLLSFAPTAYSPRS